MTLHLDEPSDTQEFPCEACGQDYPVITSYVMDGDELVAVTKTAIHQHEYPEALIDVTFGDWDADLFTDHITLGARVSALPGHGDPVAALADAAVAYPADPYWGRKLDAQAAADDERVERFWAIVDLLLGSQERIHQMIYGY